MAGLSRLVKTLCGIKENERASPNIFECNCNYYLGEASHLLFPRPTCRRLRANMPTATGQHAMMNRCGEEKAKFSL